MYTFGLSLQNWLLAFLVFFFVFLGGSLLKMILTRRLMRWQGAEDTAPASLAYNLVKDTRLLFVLAVGLYSGLRILDISGEIALVLDKLISVALFIQIGLWASHLIDFAITRRLASQETGRQAAVAATTLRAVSLVLRVTLWSLIVLLILENVTGISIGVLVTSLGIAGVAVALAVQGILGDLFASLSIALDKPFVIGDLITIADFSGTVEQIGLRSTRLRSITGEELVFSNSDLLNSRIRNFGHMQQRRGLSKLTVDYNTPRHELDMIPQLIQEIVESCENTTFVRAHLKALGDWALEYEYMYFVNSASFVDFMDVQQTINLEILRRFAEAGIEFASPPVSQTR